MKFKKTLTAFVLSALTLLPAGFAKPEDLTYDRETNRVQKELGANPDILHLPEGWKYGYDNLGRRLRWGNSMARFLRYTTGNGEIVSRDNEVVVWHYDPETGNPDNITIIYDYDNDSKVDRVEIKNPIGDDEKQFEVISMKKLSSGNTLIEGPYTQSSGRITTLLHEIKDTQTVAPYRWTLRPYENVYHAFTKLIPDKK
jgi:hypothetical protein